MALPFPSFADVLYLSCYPLYAVGLLMFIYWRTPDGDLRSLIDALTLTAGLGLLSWTFLIRPYVNNPALTGLQKTVAIAYPLGDVLMLALLARLLAPGTARVEVRAAAHRRRRRLPGVRHRLRRHPVARHVPQRDHRRPRLGPVLHPHGAPPRCTRP